MKYNYSSDAEKWGFLYTKFIHSFFMYESKYRPLFWLLVRLQTGVNSEYMCSQRQLICIQREMLHLVEEWGISMELVGRKSFWIFWLRSLLLYLGTTPNLSRSWVHLLILLSPLNVTTLIHVWQSMLYSSSLPLPPSLSLSTYWHGRGMLGGVRWGIKVTLI